MSSRNKRSAESEEVSHKKKPRKDDDDAFDENDSASEFDDDELNALDQKNVISTGRRTRGIRVDYTKVAPPAEDLDDDSDSETKAKGPKKTEGAVTKPQTRSPERAQATNVEEKGDKGEDDEGGEDEDEDDDLDDDSEDGDSEDDDDD